MRKLYPQKISSDYKIWQQLLLSQNIKPENSIDATYGLFEGDTLIATASYFNNIIKCVAIDSEYHGGAIFNELMTYLLNELYNKGHQKVYVYTKPSTTNGFKAIGFKEIERVNDDLVFMEKARHGFEEYINNLKKQYVDGERIGAIVLNANPFTLGHQYLVQQASSQVDVLHLFVVSEEASAFPKDIRKKLVIEGTKHLNNLFVHETDSYIVSSSTFPAYFLKEDVSVTTIQATLDAKIFKNHIAPALGITDRFVGDEPFSPATNTYNEAMKNIFEDISLHIIKRKEINDRAISATEVRHLLIEGDIQQASILVPQTTADYFISDEFEPIKERLKKYIKET